MKEFKVPVYKTVYIITCGASDEDGTCDIGIDKIDDYFINAEDATEQLVEFLSQTDMSYSDEKGWVHEPYDGKDQLFGRYIDDIDDETIETVYADLTAFGRQDVIDILKEQIAKLKGAA